jgi:transcriptional regulator with XRE-family HTH domain
MIPLTVRKLAAIVDVSPSYLGRIERGERFPSASVLRKLAEPLGFTESELFALAGYLSQPSEGVEEKIAGYAGGQLDPYVGRVLGGETVKVQRAAINILGILKSIAEALRKEDKGD